MIKIGGYEMRIFHSCSIIGLQNSILDFHVRGER